MFKLKIIAILIAALGASGAVAYVLWLRAENATLTANAAVKDGVIISLNEELAARQIDNDLKTEQLRKRMAQIARLTQTTAALNRKLTEATQDDEKVQECLAVRPGADFIDSLREYTQGAGNEEGG